MFEYMLVAVGSLMLVAFCVFAVVSRKDDGSAAQNAALFAADMGIKEPRINCVGWDSDGDGYVSCTLSSGDRIIALDCARSYSLNSGCRLQKLNFNRSVEVK